MKLLPTVSLLVGFVGAALAQSATATLERAKVEQEVLTAALNDLATYRGDDSPIDDVFSPNPITLNPTPLRYEMSRSTVSEQRESKAWRELPRSGRVGREEALLDLAHRMRAKGVPFQSGSSKVPLYAGPDPDKMSPFQFRRKPIEVSAPGLSKDRQVAILAVSIPWSIHGCSGLVVLVKQDRVWRVQLRDIPCYL